MIAAHRRHVSCVIHHSFCELFRLLPRILGLLWPEDWYLELLKKEELHAINWHCGKIYFLVLVLPLSILVPITGFDNRIVRHLKLLAEG